LHYDLTLVHPCDITFKNRSFIPFLYALLVRYLIAPGT